MRLGMHLRELWQHKLGLAIAVAVALLVAGRTYGFGLLPPALPKPAEGQATARILIDTPRSTMLDLRQNTYDIAELNNRALLVGNAMASVAVRKLIAGHAGVSVDAIWIETPLSVEYAESGGGAGAPSPASKYRLDIQADPTVPVIDINAAAPTGAAASTLANAAATGLNSYVSELPSSERTPPGSRIDLVRLGLAQSLASSTTGRLLPTFLVFLLLFAAGSATVVFVTRRRAGLGVGGGALDANQAS